MADETVTVELGGDASGLAASADAAAASVEQLDAATKGLGSTLDGLKSEYNDLRNAARNATDPASFQILRGQADKVARSIGAIEKELEAIEDEKRAITGVGDACDAAAADAKQLDAALEGVEGASGGMSGLGMTIATAVGSALAEAAKKALEFGVEMAKAVAAATIEADRAKRSAKGLLETYEGADAAADHYAKLSGLAKQLGVDANAVTTDFAKFHHELGLGEGASVALIKLKSDVEAIAPGTGRAEEATKRFLELVNGGMSTEHAIKTVAEEFHVAGTGADAAAAKLKNPSAALDALKTKGGELANQLATRLGPKIIETADKFAAWVDKPETMAAIGKTANAVEGALDLLVPTIEIVTAALDSQSASSTGVQVAGAALAGTVQALTAPFTAAYEAGVLVVDGFQRFSDVTGIVSGALDGAVAAVTGFVGEWTQAGTDLVNGFINGVTGAADRAVAKARELGARATAEMKSVLGIASPSKVFEELGQFTTEGFERGLEPVDVAAGLQIPEAIDVANENVAAPASTAAAPVAASAAVSSGAGGTMYVTIQIMGGGESGSTRREVREALLEVAEQMGWAVAGEAA